MRVLSIDPALRSTGFAVIEYCPDTSGGAGSRTTGSRADTSRANGFRAVAYGAIKNARQLRQSTCLVQIRQQIADIIREYQPQVCAIEGVIYVQSYRTAITMGAARGAAVLAAAEQGLEIFEYAPRRVKQAVVGRGAADKKQVAFMTRALLNLAETPEPDAADALAIGLAHCYASDPNRPLAEKPTPL